MPFLKVVGSTEVLRNVHSDSRTHDWSVNPKRPFLDGIERLKKMLTLPNTGPGLPPGYSLHKVVKGGKGPLLRLDQSPEAQGVVGQIWVDNSEAKPPKREEPKPLPKSAPPQPIKPEERKQPEPPSPAPKKPDPVKKTVTASGSQTKPIAKRPALPVQDTAKLELAEAHAAALRTQLNLPPSPPRSLRLNLQLNMKPAQPQRPVDTLSEVSHTTFPAPQIRTEPPPAHSPWNVINATPAMARYTPGHELERYPSTGQPAPPTPLPMLPPQHVDQAPAGPYRQIYTPLPSTGESPVPEKPVRSERRASVATSLNRVESLYSVGTAPSQVPSRNEATGMRRTLSAVVQEPGKYDELAMHDAAALLDAITGSGELRSLVEVEGRPLDDGHASAISNRLLEYYTARMTPEKRDEMLKVLSTKLLADYIKPHQQHATETVSVQADSELAPPPSNLSSRQPEVKEYILETPYLPTPDQAPIPVEVTPQCAPTPAYTPTPHYTPTPMPAPPTPQQFPIHSMLHQTPTFVYAASPLPPGPSAKDPKRVFDPVFESVRLEKGGGDREREYSRDTDRRRVDTPVEAPAVLRNMPSCTAGQLQQEINELFVALDPSIIPDVLGGRRGEGVVERPPHMVQTTLAEPSLSPARHVNPSANPQAPQINVRVNYGSDSLSTYSRDASSPATHQELPKYTQASPPPPPSYEYDSDEDTIVGTFA